MKRILVLLPLFLIAADWPRFRGPNGTGVAEPAVAEWSGSTNQLWNAKLPGPGNGSPIVVKGKLFVQCAGSDGNSRSLVCLDAETGKELWVKTHKGTNAKIHKKNSLASSTPAADDNQVYCCFWDGSAVDLVAYDFAGNQKWSAALGSFKGEHGAGMSPMVFGGKVFVNFDQDGAAEMLAYDAATGKKAWAQPRKAYRSCYSTPMVRDLPGGTVEIIDLSTAGLTAYDPATGKVNWDAPFSWGNKPLRSVASPVAVGDLFIAVTGDGAGDRFAAGIKPGEKPTIIWQNKSSKLAPYVPCPIAVGKHLFWVTDQGKLECVNPLTGKPVWSESVFSSSVSASPILLGDKLLMIDERGKAVVCKADPNGFEKVSTSEVGEPVFATPAAANGKLYIRTPTAILCIGKK